MASSAVLWQFGSVVLSFVQSEMTTEKITDAGDVNVTNLRHRITARGIVSRGLPPALEGETAQETFNRLKDSLMRHRRYFLYAPLGTVFLQIGDPNNPNDPEANNDEANGPKVISVRPVMLAEAAIGIEVVVEVVVSPCPANDRTVRNHHFRYAETRDLQGYRTRTLEGVIMCKNRGLTKAEAMKEAGLPAVSQGYHETDFMAGWQDDGLTLKYSRTEEQYEFRPPDEAADAKVETKIETKPENAGAYAIIFVELTGNVDRKYSEAVGRATRLAFSVANTIKRDKSDGVLPHLAYSIQGGTSRKRVAITLSVLVDMKKVVSAGGGFRPELFSTPPSGMQVQGSSAYPMPADKANETDLLRPPFQEPCGDFVTLDAPIVKRELRSVPGDPRTLSLLFQGGDPTNPAGAAGQQNFIAPGGSNVGLGSTDPLSIFTQQQIDALLSGNGNAVAEAFGVEIPTLQNGGIVPLQDVAPSLTDQYFPQPGAGVPEVSNTFGAFGSNKVHNVPSAKASVDPADHPSTYSVYLLNTTVEEVTGWDAMPAAWDDGEKGTRFPRSPISYHAGRAKLVVRWTAVRYGVPPQAPDPTPKTGNFLLKSRWVRRDQATKLTSGHLQYTWTGSYEYEILDLDNITVGDPIPPFLIQQVKKQFPKGIDDPTLAKDIIWFGFQKAPSPLFAPVRPPSKDLISINGVFLNQPGQTSPQAPLGPPPLAAVVGAVDPVQQLIGDLSGAFGNILPPYNPNPGA